jgi:hypothetical protein
MCEKNKKGMHSIKEINNVLEKFDVIIKKFNFELENPAKRPFVTLTNGQIDLFFSVEYFAIDVFLVIDSNVIRVENLIDFLYPELSFEEEKKKIYDSIFETNFEKSQLEMFSILIQNKILFIFEGDWSFLSNFLKWQTLYSEFSKLLMTNYWDDNNLRGMRTITKTFVDTAIFYVKNNNLSYPKHLEAIVEDYIKLRNLR